VVQGDRAGAPVAARLEPRQSQRPPPFHPARDIDHAADEDVPLRLGEMGKFGEEVGVRSSVIVG
jgi:hypothetical protein